MARIIQRELQQHLFIHLMKQQEKQVRWI